MLFQILHFLTLRLKEFGKRRVCLSRKLILLYSFGPKDKMVKSKSGTVPHIVSTVDGSHYKCDEKCPHFKSINICSHSVAAAEANGDLGKFLLWFRRNRSKKSPNLTELSTDGMPQGAGRKGGKAAKKKTPSKAKTLTEENRTPLVTSHQSTRKSTRSCNSPVEKSSISTPDGNWQAYNGPLTYSDPSSYSGPPSYGGPSSYSGPPSYGGPSSYSGGPSSYSGPSSYRGPSPYNSPSTSAYPPWMWPLPSSPPPWCWPGMPQASPSSYFPPSSAASTPPSPYIPRSSATPASPPPYFSHSSAPISPDPFKVCIKTGNISICNGCRNNFSRNDAIVIQHPEFRQFNSPRTGLPTSKYGNAYYHPRKRCIELKRGLHFEVFVSDEVKPKLTPPQRDELMKEFNIVLN